MSRPAAAAIVRHQRGRVRIENRATRLKPLCLQIMRFPAPPQVRDAASGGQRNDPIILYPYGRGAPSAPTRPMIGSDGRLLVSLGVPDGKTLSLVVVAAAGDNPKAPPLCFACG